MSTYEDKIEQELASKVAEKKELKVKLTSEVKNLEQSTATDEERLKALLQKEEGLSKETENLKRKEGREKEKRKRC